MIEKLGHKKRMQTMRREWIDEGKPHHQDMQDPEPEVRENREPEIVSGSGQPSNPAEGDKTSRTPPPPQSKDDLNSATRQTGPQPGVTANGENLFLSDEEAGGQPSGDELDALLAEDGFNEAHRSEPAVPAAHGSKASVRQRDDFDDEMEAMAELDDMW